MTKSKISNVYSKKIKPDVESATKERSDSVVVKKRAKTRKASNKVKTLNCWV